MRIQGLIATAVVGSALVGCGSLGGSLFGGGSDDGNGGSSSANTLGGDGPLGGPDALNSGVRNIDPNAGCASSHDGAVLQPISLVFMIDRSGSMAKENNVSTIDVRWNPVKNGLLSFFGDPNSANISASLAFYPIQVRQKDHDQDTADCSSASYQTPVVAMTALPNQAAFTSAFNTGPAGGTPTAPALQGAIDEAKGLKAQGKNVAVVLATDGEPNECNSTVDAVNTVAANGLAARIKTHVIGVGPSTGNLNSFAANGGTGTAVMIPTNDSAQVSRDLIAAVSEIASSLLGCSYGLPTPPPGHALDINAVNVNFTPPTGNPSTLAYSADCSDPKGWHYDNGTAPSQIILCQDSCSVAESTAGAKLEIIFGCTTEVQSGAVDPSGTVR